MSRPRKKPDYNPERIMNELMDAVTAIYLSTSEGKHPSLQLIGDELELNPLKVRKLLITAGVKKAMQEAEGRTDIKENENFIPTQTVYESEIADSVLDLHFRGRTIPEIMEITGLSRASVHSYLPYSRIAYKANEISTTADRLNKYRRRKESVEKFQEKPDIENLWMAVEEFADYPFYTVNGLKYSYKIKGHEMFVDRKDKSITRSTLEFAYDKAMEYGGGIIPAAISSPKKLGCFGASYIYPLFVRLGVIDGQKDIAEN